MILQEEFMKNGYKDILVGDIASEYEINLEDVFDLEQKPEELISIFISDQRDELFFLLDGDLTEINSLCDYWDNRIRVFMIINGKSTFFMVECNYKSIEIGFIKIQYSYTLRNIIKELKKRFIKV